MLNIYDKYTLAFQRAEKLHDELSETDTKRELIEKIFPELAEPEEVRIGKELREFIITTQETRLVGNRKREVWMDWLDGVINKLKRGEI